MNECSILTYTFSAFIKRKLCLISFLFYWYYGLHWFTLIFERLAKCTFLGQTQVCHCVLYRMEKAMAPHSSTLAWKVPWKDEPGRLQSMGSHRVGHDWSELAALYRISISCLIHSVCELTAFLVSPLSSCLPVTHKTLTLTLAFVPLLAVCLFSSGCF